MSSPQLFLGEGASTLPRDRIRKLWDTLSVVVDDETLQHIGRLGHELRNALTGVLTAAEVTKRRCGDDVAREHEVIERQVERMRALVDELLSITARK